MKTGDIYWVNLEPTLGDEIKKQRPVVLLNPGHVKHLRLALVVPVTGWKVQRRDHPCFVSLEPSPSNGLSKLSVVDCLQLRAVSHQRLRQKIGSISADELDRIQRAIALILDLDPDQCQ